MSGSPLATNAPPAPLARRREETTASVKADLVAARGRLAAELEWLENTLRGTSPWRARVVKHPVVTLGAALIAGYVVGRWLFRR